MQDPPPSVREFILLQRLPGYTRATLRAEDPEWVAEVWEMVQAEAAVAAQAAQRERRRT